MKVYIDCDVASKLARWGVLDEVWNTLDLDNHDVYVPASLKFRFQLQDDAKALKKCGSAAAVEQLRRFVGKVGDPPDAQDELIVVLSSEPGIDSGESVLFASAATQDDAVIITGDKKAIVALGWLCEKEERVRTLRGKILCLEQLVAHLLDFKGLSWLRQAIAVDPSADRTIHICLGSRLDAPLASVREALESYVNSLSAGHTFLAAGVAHTFPRLPPKRSHNP